MKKVQIGTLPKIEANVEDAFDRLRVNLGICGEKKKVVMITSSVSGEGKTFVSMQLWKKMAEVGIPTLLIDCDLKKSSLGSEGNVSKTKDHEDLVQYLSGQAELEDVLYETDVPNGYILSAASFTEQLELLYEGEGFARMIEDCKKKFELVLIDTPSIDNFPDVMNIAACCDGTVIVVRSASTARKTVCDCVQALQFTGIPLLGIILNCFNTNNKSNSYFHRCRN